MKNKVKNDFYFRLSVNLKIWYYFILMILMYKPSSAIFKAALNMYSMELKTKLTSE